MNKNNVKIIISLFMVGLLSLAAIPNTCRAQDYNRPIEIVINGEEKRIASDSGHPFYYNNGSRIMIPVKFVCDSFGAEINFIDENNDKYILISKGNRTIKMKVNDNKAFISENGVNKSVTLDVPLTLVKGRSYVPVRFISEAMGFRIDWDREENRDIVSISDLNKEEREYRENNNKKSDYETFTLPTGEKIRGRFIGNKNKFDIILKDYRKQHNLKAVSVAENQSELNEYNRIRALEEAYRWIETGDIQHKRLHGPLTLVNGGENLFCGFKPEICDIDAFTGWKNSPGHNKNLLCNAGDSYIYAYDTFEFTDSRNNTRTVSVLTYGVYSRFYFSINDLYK